MQHLEGSGTPFLYKRGKTFKGSWAQYKPVIMEAINVLKFVAYSGKEMTNKIKSLNLLYS
jgi:hypothetical protein